MAECCSSPAATDLRQALAEFAEIAHTAKVVLEGSTILRRQGIFPHHLLHTVNGMVQLMPFIKALVEAAGEIGGRVEYQPRWGLLWVPSAIGRYAFSVLPSPEGHVPCPQHPPVGSSVELLENAGGVTVLARVL